MELDDDGALAGWHRDPSGRHELRFWSGDAWTEHIIDEGIPGLDFPTRSGRAPGETASATPQPPPFEEIATSDEAPEANVERIAAADEGVEAEAPEVDLVAEAEAEAEAPEVAEVTADEHPDRVDAIDVATAAADVARPTRPGGRSLRTRRRTTAPTPPTPPSREPDVTSPVAEFRQDPAPQSTPAPEPEQVAEAAGSERTAEPERETIRSPEPKRTPEPVHATLDAPMVGRPTVASPAGNSAGSNTSAIADPHRAHRSPNIGEPADAPRVAGVTPVPVKRYRPGSPPPSPFARPQALPVGGGTSPVGTIIVPWYQRPAGWISVIAIVVVAALGVVAILSATSDDANNGLKGRPPAAAPQGSKIIDGDGFGIAAPAAWIVATDTGNAFPQLRHDDWGTQLAATDIANGEALIVVPLAHLRHNPQVDPELFWSDQVRDAGSTRTITPGPPFGVHGFRANRVTVTDPSGKALVAASIDTGDHTYLVAFTAPSTATATTRFERFIQTFDAR